MSSTPNFPECSPSPALSTNADIVPSAAPIPGLAQLTLPQCHDVIGRLTAQVGGLGAQINELQALVGVLQERLKLDSRNSSKPPSSDGPGSGNRAQRSASERTRGLRVWRIGTGR